MAPGKNGGTEPVDGAWLERNLEILNEVIAGSMVTDFLEPVDQNAIDDDRFRSVLFGLAMMVDDINDSRRQLEEQNRINRARAELWRMATDTVLDEHGLIQRLLDILGPVLGVSRATFNAMHGNDLVTEIEWCAAGVEPTLGTTLPRRFVEYFLNDGFTVIRHEQIIQRLPAVVRPLAAALVREILATQKIESLAYIPYRIGTSAPAVIGFDICTDCPSKPEWTDQLKQLVYDAVRIITLTIEQRRTREELVRSHTELEARVELRASELHDANATLEQSLREKEVLLKEIHHRVKNNLQVISSLLNLQSRHLSDPRDRSMFVDSQNRIKSMALIHERLYQTGDLARVRFDSYIERLTTDLFHTYSVDSRAVSLVRRVEPLEMTVDRAIPCSLIVSELVSNALKYAYKGRTGTLRIELAAAADGTARLTVADDGPGLPPGTGTAATESLGLQLVHTLADQLDGTLAVTNEPGATFVLDFPLAAG